MGSVLGSKALELAISLSLFFFLSSLICTAAREMIEAVLKTRALDLERAMRELLADPTGTGAVREIFAHPIVAGLFLGSYDPSSVQATDKRGRIAGKLDLAGRRNLPSYIPSGQFAAALVDIVVRGGEEVPYAPPRPTGPIDLARLRAEAERVTNPALQAALQVATDGAATLDEAKLRIEAWFNGSMDRASGWYKRRTQWILFALGLATAVLMNLDTITVTRRLFEDGDLRSAAVSAAEARSGVRAPVPAATATQAPAHPSVAATKAHDTVQGLRDDLRDIGLPMGWTLQPYPWPAAQAQLCPTAPQPCGLTHGYVSVDAGGGKVTLVTAGSLILMPLGWIITALAVTLGAPFWFDVLNKFVIVRATVKPSQKSQDEASPERTLRTSPAGGDMVPGNEVSVTGGASAARAVAPPSPEPGAEAADPLVINRWAVGSDPDEGLL